MAEIKKTGGHIDYMARDYDSLLKAMKELIPEKLPEWKDYNSEADFGNVLLQLFAHMGDIVSYYQDRVANESFLSTARNRRSIISHLKLIGYRFSTAAPASTELKLTFPADCSETVVIRQGDAFATKSRKDKPSVRFEYTRKEELIIDCENPKGIPVEEGRLIRDELIGTSKGTANQRFTLAHTGLILRSLGESQKVNRDIVLITRSGGRLEEWALKESLAFSREKQKNFVIEIDDKDSATLIFGDGSFGEIPPMGADIIVTYRVGGGIHGNVLSGSIQTIVDAPQLSLLGATVRNSKPATGGAELESIEHAVKHSPNIFRSLKRAITAGDYESLALDFRGVGKVLAEGIGWNRVILFVAPEGGGFVSDVLRANLLAYFEDKRPVSTIIEIGNVDYVAIYVTAEVGISGYYSEEQIKKEVQEATGELLAFNNVDFGQIIYLSKFYEAIENIEGVEYVNIKEFKRDGQKEKMEPSGKIELSSNEIATPPNRGENQEYFNSIKVEFPK